MREELAPQVPSFTPFRAIRQAPAATLMARFRPGEKPWGGEHVTSQVVSYEVEDGTEIRFEIEPTDEWQQVGSGRALGQIREAVAPAVQGARAVLEQVKALQPGEVQVKFGVKVTGTANWLIARAATEANFEITLTWPGTVPDAP